MPGVGNSSKTKAHIAPDSAKWKRNPNLPCPCGSKKEYGMCCGPVIANCGMAGNLNREAQKYVEDSNIEAAESLYRAHFVQYLCWVHEHTMPFLTANLNVVDELVETDIGAFVELTEAMAHCLFWLERKNEIIPLINHVESVVPLKGFRTHVPYLRATWLYIALRDREGARSELRKLGDILAYGRREAIELYLDVFGDEIPERQKIVLADGIIAQAGTDDAVRLQYTAIKAIGLMQIGELPEAVKEMRSVLDKVEPPSKVESVDEIAAIWQLAKAWSLLGTFTQDKDSQLKAEELFSRIPENLLKTSGKAELLINRGWAFRDQERFNDSAISFRRSLGFQESVVGKIQLAHSLALCDEIDEARRLLNSIDPQSIDPKLQLEYFAAISSIAIASNDFNLANKAVGGLRTAPCDTPYWIAQRDQLIIQILDFIHRPGSTHQLERQRKIVRVLCAINESLELKPNIFGIGVNFNRVIENLIRIFGS